MAPLSPQTLRIAAAILIALLLQVALAPHMDLGGVHAELLLAVTLAAAMVGGTTSGVAAGFVAGLLVDSLDGLPMGLSALGFCLAGLAVAAVAEHANDVWWVRALLGVLGTVVSVTVIVVAGAAFGHPVISALSAVEVIFVVGAMNAVLVPLIGRGLGQPERHREHEGMVW